MHAFLISYCIYSIAFISSTALAFAGLFTVTEDSLFFSIAIATPMMWFLLSAIAIPQFDKRGNRCGSFAPTVWLAEVVVGGMLSAFAAAFGPKDWDHTLIMGATFTVGAIVPGYCYVAALRLLMQETAVQRLGCGQHEQKIEQAQEADNAPPDPIIHSDVNVESIEITSS
jgi:hypothetical protein